MWKVANQGSSPESWCQGFFNLSSIWSRIATSRLLWDKHSESLNYSCGYGKEKSLIRNNSDTESIGLNSKNLVNSDTSEKGMEERLGVTHVPGFRVQGDWDDCGATIGNRESGKYALETIWRGVGGWEWIRDNPFVLEKVSVKYQ